MVINGVPFFYILIDECEHIANKYKRSIKHNNMTVDSDFYFRLLKFKSMIGNEEMLGYILP